MKADGRLIDRTRLAAGSRRSSASAPDALNRVLLRRLPEDVDTERKELHFSYNRAGALASVILDRTTYVERLAYNARGQRILLALGNGVMTRYAYDPQTFRLTRMRSERYSQSGLTYTPSASSSPLQDLSYTYDLAGNPRTIQDRTSGCGVSNNPDAANYSGAFATLLSAGDALIRDFDYDPLYRLTRATGRECDDISSPRPWTDDNRCGYGSGNHGNATQDNAPSMTAVYEESYTYDPADNLVRLKHTQGTTTWNRYMGVGGMNYDDWMDVWPEHLGDSEQWDNAPSNRLTHAGDADLTSATHTFDVAGNLLDEGSSRHHEWDHAKRLRVFRTQTSGSGPSVHAQYLYDSSGQRVKKLVRKQGGSPLETTVYMDGAFEYQKIESGGTEENNTLHVMDDQRRIAMVRVGTAFTADSTPAEKFILEDHLGSSAVVVSDTGSWVNREEFSPYGETLFGSFARKRYRYTG